MKITVKYFAALRDFAKTEEEKVFFEGGSAAELYHILCKKHGIGLRPENLKVAVNQEYAEFDRKLREGDTVVFIPPVAGG